MFLMTNTQLLIGTRKGLMILEKGARGWQVCRQAFLAIPVSYAATDPRNGVFWTCLEHGHWGSKLHRSRDKGMSWQEVEMPKYPEGTDVTLSYLWIIAPGGNDQPQRLYLGTEPGGLFMSEDGGDSFQLVESLWNHPSREKNWFGGGRDHPGLCSIIVDPRDSQHIIIGISVGGVYESTDGGLTWEGRNKGLKACYLPNPAAEYGHDPHFITAAPSNPEVLWMQNHCGIFRSTDSGKNWQDVSAKDGHAFFGFAIAVDEQNADTAWVVPAISDEKRMTIDGALCVCRTEDGGKTWTDLRQGLPQEHCYDLVYRHALDIEGNRLAFGTTTGNLFISEDRGKSWECVSNYLPPIYSVRFANFS
jgi:photosystem II stability/assembly factor-like uncharacterized protein